MSSANSALYIGLSGLDANQQYLNVTGNNIANANTTAFKASIVQFLPQFYTTDQAGTAPNGNFGGTNPSQEGSGTEIAQVTQDFSGGAISNTGVPTDLAINGNGFFVINSASGGQQYTRDGEFTLNDSDQLVTSGGAFVQGYGVNASGNIVQGALTNLTIPIGQTTSATPTQNVILAGNLNSGGNIATGASILSSQALALKTGATSTTLDGTTLLTDLASAGTPGTALFNVGDTLSLSGTQGSRDLPTASMTVTATTTVTDLENFYNNALNINTATAGPPAPGTTLYTDANGNTFLDVVGNTGTQNSLTLGSTGLTDTSSTGTASSPLTQTSGSFVDPTSGVTYVDGATGESAATSITAYDSLGNPITINLTAVLQSKSSTGDTWSFTATSPQNQGTAGDIVGSGTLTYDTNGNLVTSTGTTVSIDRTGTGANSPLDVKLNFAGVSGDSSSTSDIVMNNQDGSPSGTLSTYSIGEDGTITGTFSNGSTKTLGQVAMANFDNDQGLVDNGDNIYEAGANSGAAQIGVAQQNGAGSIQSGALEQSNVNLSKEFINLIIASTGFSASSKVITTSDELLTDLINAQR